MIAGFPGETAADFGESMSLVEQVRFSSMFSFSYSERPGTLAAKRMADDVPDAEKSSRLGALQQLQKRIQQDLHHQQVGRTFEVLADSVSRRRDWEVSGRTSGNTVVNFPGQPDLLGKMVQVRIERAGPNSLWGRRTGETEQGKGERPKAEAQS